MKCPALHIVDNEIFPTWQWFVPKRRHSLKFSKLNKSSNLKKCKIENRIFKNKIVSWKRRMGFMLVIVRRGSILAFAF